MISIDVIIIGGGVTGMGILRDLSMRGIKAILLEQGGLAHGTSSRFHGLLHSGARYSVNDPESAKECIEENFILRKIAAQSIELTEGFFVATKTDDPNFTAKWLEANKIAGIDAIEIGRKKALELEPNLSPNIAQVYSVPDSSVDGFRLVWHNAISSRQNGGKVLTYHEVVSINHNNGTVTGVTAINKVNGETIEFNCNYIVNASGSWAKEIANMAKQDVNILPDRGTLIVFNHRFTTRIINRLHPSSDGDIFVPHGSITILGTTSAPAKSPSDNEPTTEEIKYLLDIGKDVFPDVNNYRILRAFAGTRPLFADKGSGRKASRNFHIVDHNEFGLKGMLSIFGGKLTTYRLMAEKATDVVAKYFNNTKKCETATTPILQSPTKNSVADAKKYLNPNAIKLVSDRVGSELHNVVKVAKDLPSNDIICECEMVSLAEIKYAANDPTTHYLNDIRLRTRLGMGTCQGTFCSLRAIAALEDLYSNEKMQPRDHVRLFLQERWKGVRPALFGVQLKETELSRAIYLATLNFDGGSDEKI